VRSRSVFVMSVVPILACVLAPAAWGAGHGTAREAAWTVMVYMDGDNNLEKFVTKDIETELCALGSSTDVNVVCLADRRPGFDRSRGDWRTTKLYYCTKGMRADAASAAADWGERDMGDRRTLIDFVTWTRAHYPAGDYVLAFWDHGYLWMPDAYNLRDDTSGSYLNDDEQVAAMQAAGPVSVVAWDCCQRQLAEVAANWQPYAQAMAGSESWVNWEGIRYDALIDALRETPSLSPQQASDCVASTAGGDGRTFSSVTLDGRFDRLLEAVDDLSAALEEGLPLYRETYAAARKKTQVYSGGSEFDLWDAAHDLSVRVPDPVIKARCAAVMAAVAADVSVNWKSASRQVRNSHGLAIWWPITKAGLNKYAPTDFAYYRQMRFSQLTGWDDFLAAFCQ
jgi:hypothetical protein